MMSQSMMDHVCMIDGGLSRLQGTLSPEESQPVDFSYECGGTGESQSTVLLPMRSRPHNLCAEHDA